MGRQIKFLGLALVMLLGLYPIVELTRVIIVSGTYYFPDMDAQFIAEIIIMWILYLSIIPVFLILNQKILNNNQFMNKREIKPARKERHDQTLPVDNKDFIRIHYIK